jgi:type IV pilus assembly protein PilE
MTKRRRLQAGFTLVELMIACSVIAILSAIALPSFAAQVQKSRRADAYEALAAVQHAQERHRSLNAQYAASLTELGLGEQSSGGHYALSLSDSHGQGYTLTAVRAKGDAACHTLKVTVLRGTQSRSANAADGSPAAIACFPS